MTWLMPLNKVISVKATNGDESRGGVEDLIAQSTSPSQPRLGLSVAIHRALHMTDAFIGDSGTEGTQFTRNAWKDLGQRDEKSPETSDINDPFSRTVLPRALVLRALLSVFSRRRRRMLLLVSSREALAITVPTDGGETANLANSASGLSALSSSCRRLPISRECHSGLRRRPATPIGRATSFARNRLFGIDKPRRSLSVDGELACLQRACAAYVSSSSKPRDPSPLAMVSMMVSLVSMVSNVLASVGFIITPKRGRSRRN